MGYAYSVGIKLSVANLASQGLRVIAKDILGLFGATTNLQSKLSALKLAGVGYGLDKMGLGIFHGLEKTISASRDYVSQLSLMNAAGMSHAEIVNSIGAAWSTSHQVLTSTAAENLKQLRELRSIFGTQHMSEAYAILPSVMRTQGVLEALTGQKNDNIGFQMAKVAELRQTGVMTLPFLQRNIDELSRTLMAMGGTINANDFLMTMKYAKTAGLSLSDRFVYDFLPTFMQEVKGGGGFMGNTSTAGTSIMRLYTQIVQGLVKKSAIPIWEEMGLIRPSDVVRNATVGFQIRPGGVAGAKLFAEDPLAWVEKFTPAIDHYAARHHLTQLQAITSMGLPQNAAWALSTLMLKDAQFRRDQQLIQSTPSSLETYNRLLKTNPMLAEQALHAQWQNVQSIIGYSILPKILPLMVSFAGDLNSLSGWFQKHPRITRDLVIDLGAMSGALVVLGNVMMGKAVLNFLGIGPAISKMMGSTVGAVSAQLKVLGAAAVSFTAGYVAGTEIWKHALEGNKGGDAVSSAVAHIMALFGSQAAKDAIKTNSAWNNGPIVTPVQHPAQHGQQSMPPRPATHIVTRGTTTTVVHTQVNLDGRKLADVVTRHLTRAVGRPQTGSSYFDGSAALVPAGGVADF